MYFLSIYPKMSGDCSNKFPWSSSCIIDTIVCQWKKEVYTDLVYVRERGRTRSKSLRLFIVDTHIKP